MAGTVNSPWVWESGDYRAAVIRITVNFDNTTRALVNASVFRDATCVYRNIYVGLGPDGTPNTGRTIPVPAGTSTVNAAQMAAKGFATIEDVINLQITAGP